MSKHNADDGGFLSRWSRRKAQVQQGPAESATAPAAADAAAANLGHAAGVVAAGHSAPRAPATAGTVSTATATATAAAGASGIAAPARSAADGSPLQPHRAEGASASHASPRPEVTPPKPTLQDVEQLDAGSDYRAYVARDVDPQVRNAAFKKLFHSDPHFNVMDGLDVYIDDYNTPNPLPVAIMKTLVQARALGLIDDELKEQDPPQADSSSAVESAHGDEGNTEIAAAEPSSAVGEDGLVEPSSPASTPVESSWTIDQDPEPEPLVELKLVPDTACNDEPLSLPSDGPTAAGTVVPFPRRPGSADPV